MIALLIVIAVLTGAGLFLHFTHNAKLHALDLKLEAAVEKIVAEIKAKL